MPHEKTLNIIAESLKEIQKIVKDDSWQKLRESLSWKKEDISSSLRKLREYLGDNPNRNKKIRVLNLLNAVARGGIMTDAIKSFQKSLKSQLEKSAGFLEEKDSINSGTEEPGTSFDFRTNREMSPDNFYTDNMYGGSLEKGYPWFIYMKSPSVFPAFITAIKDIKAGKLKEITADITPVKSITPSLTPRVTYPVAPKLTTDPGASPGIFPNHPYFHGLFSNTSKCLNIVKESMTKEPPFSYNPKTKKVTALKKFIPLTKNAGEDKIDPTTLKKAIKELMLRFLTEVPNFNKSNFENVVDKGEVKEDADYYIVELKEVI